jgi:urease accessory protein
MTMDEFAEELDVMQLSDSFFPTGLFATSNGLESLFLSKQVTTAQQIVELNRVYIEQQVGPVDCVTLSNAFEFAKSGNFEKIKELDLMCSALRSIKETREAAIRSGVQLARCVKEFQANDKILNLYYQNIENQKISGIYPVSFAICCNALGIKKEKALLMMLYGFVVSNVGAALRLGIIHHFEGQKIIHQLKPLILKAVKDNVKKTTDEIWQFSPQIEINQMAHERLDSKMFIT